MYPGMSTLILRLAFLRSAALAFWLFSKAAVVISRGVRMLWLMLRSVMPNLFMQEISA